MNSEKNETALKNELLQISCAIKNNKKLYLFILFILSAFLAHFFYFARSPEGTQRSLFFAGFADLCADFFNTCMTIADRNPYFTDRFLKSVYLPIVNIIFYPFTKFADYKNFTLQDCWNSSIAMFTCFLFVFFTALLLIHSMYCLCKKYGTDTKILVAILFSSVFLFTLERANILVFSTALLFYFLAYYDSDSTLMSLFAAICLSLVSCIKIHPVLFGLLYLVDFKKHYVHILIAFIFGILFAFLPFLFFKHGFANLPKLMEILSSAVIYNSDATFSFDYGLSKLFGFFFHREMDFRTIGRIIVYVLAAFSLLLAFCTKDSFKRLLLIIFSVLYLPPFSYFYCALYLIPALIYFFGKDKPDVRKIEEACIFLLFCFIFMPLVLKPIHGFHGYTLKFLFINFFCFLLWPYLLVTEARMFLKGGLNVHRTS